MGVRGTRASLGGVEACARVALAAWATALLCGCGDDNGRAADAGPRPDGAAPVDGAGRDAALPDHVRASAYAVNIADPSAAAELDKFLRGAADEDLWVAGRSFYDVFGDDYDFLYLVTEEDLGGEAAGGRYRAVRHPAEPEIGLPAALDDTSYGSDARLQGIVGLNLSAAGNGPTLHETLHRWATFLDRSLGFGVDRSTDWGAHWGVASVDGQHGGFDAATLRCEATGGAPETCIAGTDGWVHYNVAPFNPNQNGGDAKPYAPIELYLMGLLAPEDVPSPILVLEDAVPIGFDDPFIMEASGIREVTMDEIIATHGRRALLPEEARHFRAAFVLLSDTPVDDATLAIVDRWSAIFGGDEPSSFLLSFETATGARATMDTHAPTP